MSIYTYSCTTNSDSITCCDMHDTMEEAYKNAVKAAEKTEEFSRMFFGDEQADDFVMHHRVFFVGENGEKAVLGANIHETDEPTTYSLYIGMIGTDLVFLDESEDCDYLADNFRKTLHETHNLMSIIDKEEADKFRDKMLGIIIKSNDRNFIHSIN